MLYPQYREQVAAFVETHRRNLAEAVLLALYYAPQPGSEDVYILEVLTPTGVDTVSAEKGMLAAEFASTLDFPMGKGGRLHVTLTTPAELQTAIEGDWNEVREIKQAVSRHEYEVIHEDAQAKHLTRQLLEQDVMVAA